MVDEIEAKPEGQEESEYHFSDEQMNYEMDETSAQEEPKAATPQAVSTGKRGLRQYMTGGIIFFTLIYFVYKMLSPSATQPAVEITQVESAKSAISAQQHQGVQGSAMPHPSISAGTAPSAGMQMHQQQPVQASPQAQVPMPQVTMATVSNPPDAKSMVDKLDALAQQSVKIEYVLGTEYPQKFAAYEEQNTTLQAKVRDLTARIASLEASLNQLTQALQGVLQQPQQALATQQVGGLKSKSVEPRVNYTVQAIIPGRAWLKSEAGDTLTIAEGDVLKNFGRVTKIDPYDGVVEVDTGTKVINLTYGGGSE